MRKCCSSQGDPANVRALLEESLAVCRKVGHKEGIAAALCLLGEVAFQQGDAVKARSLLEESMLLSKEIGDRLGTARRVYDLGRVAFGEGDLAVARALYEEGLTVFLAVKSKWFITASFEALAAAVLVQGQPTWAARLCGCAEILREGPGTPIAPVHRAGYERSVAAAWAEGRSMTPDQVLDVPGRAEASIRA